MLISACQKSSNTTVETLRNAKKRPHYKRSLGVLKSFILLQFLTVYNSCLQWCEYLDLNRNK